MPILCKCSNLLSVLIVACGIIANSGFQAPEEKVDIGAFVVGGVPTQPNEFPSMVNLLIKVVDNTNERYERLCGGSIIHSQWILTAAHCFDSGSDEMKIEFVSVVAGDHSLSTEAPTEQRINASKRIVHEYYNTSPFDNDIALIFLSIPFQLNDNVQIASVAHSTYPAYENTPSTIVGWGSTGNKAGKSDVLLKAVLNIISNAECKQHFQFEKYNKPVEGFEIVDSMLCTLDEGVGPCLGDSGGPLFCTTETEGPFVCGVTSLGDGECANEEYPGVFTRISSHIDWIKRHVPDLKTSGYTPTTTTGFSITTDKGSANIVQMVSLIFIPLAFLVFNEG